MSLDDLFESAGDLDELKELKLIVKADVQGSIEAIEHSLSGVKSDKVKLNILSMDVGNITVNDVMLASASDAIVLGFNVGKENGSNAAANAKAWNSTLALFMSSSKRWRAPCTALLDPMLREQVVGEAEILEVFEFSKKSKIAGCMITSGRVTSKCSVRIKRGGELIFEGKIGSLKRFQNVAQLKYAGQECGIRPDNFTNFEVGDVIEAYLVEKITQNL